MNTKDNRIAAHLQDMAGAVDRTFEKLVGSRVNFSIIVWAEEGETDKFQYVANVPREDVLRCMKEVIRRWEAGTPHAKPSQLN